MDIQNGFVGRVIIVSILQLAPPVFLFVIYVLLFVSVSVVSGECMFFHAVMGVVRCLFC